MWGQATELCDLADPSDERARLGREIRGVQRPERREHTGPDLIQALGLRQILEAVQSEVGELDRRLEQAAGLVRQHDLPPVACGADAGRPVDVDTDVALVGAHRRACVNPDTHPEWPAHKRLRRLASRRYCVRSDSEYAEDRVALRIDLDAPVSRERSSQQTAVFRKHLGIVVSELGQQTCRALDVREEQRDGAGRQISHA